MAQRRTLALMLCSTLAVTTAWAGPFASQIAWSASTANFASESVDIQYFLSSDADTVTISVVPALGGAPVASFGASTQAGLHTVTWNGTVDNASGPLVPGGDHRLEIRVQAVGSPEWSAVRTNSVPGGGGGSRDTARSVPGQQPGHRVRSREPDFRSNLREPESG